MRCFNHPDKEAVATCQKCGKGLCRECAEKHTPCLCDTCAVQIQQDEQKKAQSKEEQRKQKYKDALVDTRGEFIKTTLSGILVGIICMWLTTRDGESYAFVTYVAAFFLCFCIPFGWKFITYLQSFFPNFIIIGSIWFWVIYDVVKVVLAVIVGIPAFVYQLIKTIFTQRKINKLK